MYETFEELLKHKGLTASKVSKNTGIATSTFTDWKKGRYTPKADKMQKIADFLGVSVGYLMTGKDVAKESDSGKKYYFDDETAALAQELMEKPHLRTLLDAERNISPETANALVALISAQVKQEESRHG